MRSKIKNRTSSCYTVWLNLLHDKAIKLWFNFFCDRCVTHNVQGFLICKSTVSGENFTMSDILTITCDKSFPDRRLLVAHYCPSVRNGNPIDRCKVASGKTGAAEPPQPPLALQHTHLRRGSKAARQSEISASLGTPRRGLRGLPLGKVVP